MQAPLPRKLLLISRSDRVRSCSYRDIHILGLSTCWYHVSATSAPRSLSQPLFDPVVLAVMIAKNSMEANFMSCSNSEICATRRALRFLYLNLLYRPCKVHSSRHASPVIFAQPAQIALLTACFLRILFRDPRGRC